MSPRRLIVPAALVAASALALAGCASAEASGSEDGRIAVVASTNVYGQLVEEIGADRVAVTSIVAAGSQDPHSFEPSARDQLSVSRADLIVENGGGYDSFVDALIDATGTAAHVITAVEFSHDWPENDGHAEEEAGAEGDHADEEHDHDHADHGHVEGFNEHVWYDPHTIVHVAEAIAEELSELSPDDAATFDANLETFAAGIEDLEASLGEIDAAHGGEEIFVTEPVPLYLTGAAGLLNVAPEAFTEAVEEGQDVAPATLLDALDLVSAGTVRAVIANAQTGGAETTAIIDEAESREIPVVEFTETLPDGQTYLSWMQSNIEALGKALAE
ncbi:zinc ABC transporter substrate-binding protein [Microbacterium lacus]|uniref:metal ABC transporter solute-binding protein, Zn/Mn family n=1 Tax=Microbacterium lacus TaxID=415217 RepID=UPI00384AA590